MIPQYVLSILDKFKSTTVLGKALRIPLNLLPKNLIVTIPFGVNKGMRWIVGAGNHGFWTGTRDMEEQLAITRLAKPGMVVFDIGAHCGFYTLAFSRLVGNQGKVFSFEPNPYNLVFLSRHLTMNHISNTVILPLAVSKEKGLMFFDFGHNTAQGFLTHKKGIYLSPVVSLDKFVFDHLLPFPDLVKIDVEGNESNVLAGFLKTLELRKTCFYY
ncbi:FkbM family methyltransferase [Methylacidiphilum caldifontis]|uniref:Methyltransferase FkbM domain-containing protein n=1 Tax=Methylacidiphilum caldifontis TaxID=2795386 RepID=A0A4Y8P865_9BACT|nr:FkbM family methyltransferase [Methylacidiphilum caldifontis]TFE66592.1 hypothetical protein A7Q10_02125 [Methylacidiphilum caldifontis]